MGEMTEDELAADARVEASYLTELESDQGTWNDHLLRKAWTVTDQRYPANPSSTGETAPDAVTGLLDRLIERVRTMPPNGVISRWENVSRSGVIDILLEARADLEAPES